MTSRLPVSDFIYVIGDHVASINELPFGQCFFIGHVVCLLFHQYDDWHSCDLRYGSSQYLDLEIPVFVES